MFDGKRGGGDLLVRGIACLAEGVSIWGTARVFAVAAKPVRQWGVEAAEPRHACSRPGLHAVRGPQGHLDALVALLSAVQDHAGSAAEAIECRERSPQGVWVAMDPERRRLRTLEVGDRTLARGHRVVQQVAQVLAAAGAPRLLPDGLRESLVALLTHCGPGLQARRRQATGPGPKPRWRPRPRLR